ncbi:MAG: 5-oxoprolinase subunit PxpB [Burkholderiaceae bacterium]|nr:5-oxoprolinase subunit PxpB [Betaproteobacteria bacterium]
MSYKISVSADDMLMVDFDDASIANEIVRSIWTRLTQKPLAQDVEPVPGIACIGFMLTPSACSAERIRQLTTTLEALIEECLAGSPPMGRVIELPICYESSFGLDLERVAKLQEITTREVIELHASGTYLAELIGFLPGFAYLGGLHSTLHVSRLDTPRKAVPPGGLGIAGQHTAIYPAASPGGWNLIGCCPIRLFDPSKTIPCAISLNDQVSFQPITKNQFDRLWAKR